MYNEQKQVSPLTVRLARNFLLDETDWAMVSDCGLSEEDKALYVKYRQKLRDLTTTDEFAADVEGTKFRSHQISSRKCIVLSTQMRVSRDTNSFYH